MSAMFSCVHFAGASRFLIAAFSAGSPNASQPIGISTFWPRMRRCRYMTSLIV